MGLARGDDPTAHDPGALRYDIGLRVRAMERAWEAVDDPVPRALALPHLERAVTAFFALRLDEVGRSIDGAREALEPSPPVDALARARARGLSVGLSRRVLDPRSDELRVIVAELYRREPSVAAGTVSLSAVMMLEGDRSEPRRALQLPTLHGDVSQLVPDSESPPGPTPAVGPFLTGPFLTPRSMPVLDVSAALSSLPGGDHQLRILWKATPSDRRVDESEQVVSLIVDVDARLSAMRARVESLPAGDDPSQRATIRHVLGILEQLRSGKTLETDYPAARLLGEIESAAGALGEGRRYYGGGRAGEFWMALEEAGDRFEARVFVPTEASDGPRPLVLALHGAGGSENLFFDGYGAGKIVRLCRARGWYLLATRSGLLGSARFERAVDAVQRTFMIDKEHVFMVGHSLGAMQAIATVSRAAGEFAAVAALGGGGAPTRQDPRLPQVPFWIAAGARDFGRGQAASLARRLRAIGVEKVTFREYPNVEHIGIVQAALSDVFAFFDEIQKTPRQGGKDGSR